MIEIKLLQIYYSRPPGDPAYCCNPWCIKSKNKQYTERGYIMHMKAFPSCCNFVLRNGVNSNNNNNKQDRKRPVISAQAPTDDDDDDPAEIGSNKVTNPLTAAGPSSTPPMCDHISVLTDDFESERVVATTAGGRNKSFGRCPNPNCPKSNKKIYTVPGYSHHLNAFPACLDFLSNIGVPRKDNGCRSGDKRKRVDEAAANESSPTSEASSGAPPPMCDDISVLTDDFESERVVATTTGGRNKSFGRCPNPNCPKSSKKIYTVPGYSHHLNAFPACLDFLSKMAFPR